jgi:hypothetical protein
MLAAPCTLLPIRVYSLFIQLEREETEIHVCITIFQDGGQIEK